MGDFSLAFQNITTKSIKKTENVIKKTVFDLTSSIIGATPVDSGRLKGNWQVDLNTNSNNSIIDIEDKTGNTATAKAQSKILNSKVPFYYMISNNLPYASYIEYGGSKIKAPQGMVRINVQRFNKFLKDNAKGL